MLLQTPNKGTSHTHVVVVKEGSTQTNVVGECKKVLGVQLQVVANYVTTTNDAHTAMNADKEANKTTCLILGWKHNPICFVTYICMDDRLRIVNLTADHRQQPKNPFLTWISECVSTS